MRDFLFWTVLQMRTVANNRIKMTSRIEILTAVFLLICFGEAPKALAQEVRPGIWAGNRFESSPLPTTI
jgi:hypothetical protein